jgi:hypothetical protein
MRGLLRGLHPGKHLLRLQHETRDSESRVLTDSTAPAQLYDSSETPGFRSGRSTSYRGVRSLSDRTPGCDSRCDSMCIRARIWQVTVHLRTRRPKLTRTP